MFWQTNLFAKTRPVVTDLYGNLHRDAAQTYWADGYIVVVSLCGWIKQTRYDKLTYELKRGG